MKTKIWRSTLQFQVDAGVLVLYSRFTPTTSTDQHFDLERTCLPCQKVRQVIGGIGFRSVCQCACTCQRGGGRGGGRRTHLRPE